MHYDGPIKLTRDQAIQLLGRYVVMSKGRAKAHGLHTKHAIDNVCGNNPLLEKALSTMMGQKVKVL